MFFQNEDGTKMTFGVGMIKKLAPYAIGAVVLLVVLVYLLK